MCVDSFLFLLKTFKNLIQISWINHDIAHHKALRSGSASDWSSYRSLCNKANSMLRSAKARHFSDLSSSLRGNPGKFLRHFQSLSRYSKPHSDIQFSATADKHLLSIPHT